MQYNTTNKGKPFCPPPSVDLLPLQYFKQMFDDHVIDHIVEQTTLHSLQSTGTSIAVDHNENVLQKSECTGQRKQEFPA